MKLDEIAKFLSENIEPFEDKIYGNRYRAAAHLKDGTFLPCVVFQSKRAQLELALRRFKELRWKRSQYRAVVETFVSAGSRVWGYHVNDIEVSPYAWPVGLLRQIHGETTMGWTAFVAEMQDGTMHSYGTGFNFEFFDVPQGYSHSDVTRIHSGKVYSKVRGLEEFSIDSMKEMRPYTDKPFFTCYLDELDGVR